MKMRDRNIWNATELMCNTGPKKDLSCRRVGRMCASKRVAGAVAGDCHDVRGQWEHDVLRRWRPSHSRLFEPPQGTGRRLGRRSLYLRHRQLANSASHPRRDRHNRSREWKLWRQAATEARRSARLSAMSPISRWTQAGNLYIADASNHRIRKVTPGGIVTTVAGTGAQGSSGDGGPAIDATLNRPISVALDAAGTCISATVPAINIRRVSLASGIIVTYAGNGVAAYSGDGGPAAAASLQFPLGVATDRYGYLYIADAGNNSIRRVSPGD